MQPFRFHVFVCTQQKPEGVPSCPDAGSFAVLSELDRELQARGLGNDVQLTTCGCMGLCDEGPVMVVYPEGVWYRHVRPPDIAEIVTTHLESGKVVDRLVWNDAAAMKAMSLDHGDKFRAAMMARDKAGTLLDPLEQAIRGFMPSRCILTALEFDIFTAVGAGATTDQIAAQINASTRGVSMLLNALVSLRLLRKTGDRYENTLDSARFFTQESKDNHRNGLLHTANIWHRWSTLTETVRRGSRVPIDRDTSQWTKNFISAMQRNASNRAPYVVKALGTSGIRRILDLGGGSGIYSIAFAKASREVRCDLLDLPEVIPLTGDYVEKAGVTSQVRLLAGDMLRDDLDSGYDLVMLNAICHMFSEQQNRELFHRIRHALVPGGRIAVQDFILNPDKTGSQHAALFALNMLVGTEAGSTYSEPEYTAWMKSAGFNNVSRLTLPGPSDLIVGQ